MRMPLSPITLAVGWGAIATVTASILGAQIGLRYQYQHWHKPDRDEGLKDSRLVSGERLEFVSAIARCELQTSPKPDRISVGFSSNEAADVSITVRDLEQNYWMEPTDEQGNKIFKARSGFNSFTWKADVVNYMQRTLQDLYAKIERKAAYDYVLPAIVFDSGTRLPLAVHAKYYEFAFVPHAEAHLSYRVLPGNSSEVKSKEQKLDDLPEDRVQVVRWEPINQPDGVYELVGTATFNVHEQGVQKEGVQKLQQKIDVKFYHINNIILR